MENEKRLIDAKPLMEDGWHLVRTGESNTFLGSMSLADVPTVDAVPVVHGYWIDSTSVDHMGRIIKHSIDCSVCENVFKNESRDVVKRWKEQFKVCPFCGAKMDGKSNVPRTDGDGDV